MLITAELGQKIKCSRETFSRQKFEEFKVNSKLGLKEKCSERCLQHNHGVISPSQQSSFLQTLSDVDPLQGLPPLLIIRNALTSLQRFEDKNEEKIGCIFWKGYLKEYFTRVDLCLLKDILLYSMETKKQLRKEKSLMRKKATRPIGMPELSGSFDRLIEEAWEHRVVENDLHFDTELGQQLNEEELLQSAVADEANIMYSNKKLNTESIQAMIDPKGYLTSEAAEYNCKLLDEQYPESKFIYLSQFLAKKEVRELHALELNLKTYKHLHFIFNRSNKQIFDTQQLGGHHYAIATIRADGNVFFGDSLYKNIPSNLKNVLTEYYYIKFEKPLEKIINLSGRKNFPRQTDSNLCGFIALMIMTLVENETILELFNSSVNFSELRNNSFLIFKPSLYNLYLRQVFMKAYSVSSLMQNMFVTETGFALINQFVTQVEKPLNPEGFQEKFVSIPGNHKKQASDCIQPKTPPPKNSYQSISEAAEDILTNNDLDEKTEADVSKIVDEVVQSDFVGIVV